MDLGGLLRWPTCVFRLAHDFQREPHHSSGIVAGNSSVCGRGGSAAMMRRIGPEPHVHHPSAVGTSISTAAGRHSVAACGR
jgi:hypothetical protein